MDKKELFERLQLFGVSLYDEETVADGIDIKILPSFRGNYGFFHLKTATLETIILKGVYNDFYRIISGTDAISKSEYSTIARTLNDAHGAIEKQLELDIYLSLGLVYLKDFKIIDHKKTAVIDRRDVRIPRPLTSSEYLAPADTYLDDTDILSTSFLNPFLPNVLSPISMDLFKKMPDILNPFFSSLNIKTSSPSIIPLHNRPYINLSSFEAVLDYIKIGSNQFRLNYSTNLYIKNKSKDSLFKRRFMPDSYDEIIELMTELERKTPKIDMTAIISQEVFNCAAWITIIHEYVMLELINAFTELNLLTAYNKNNLKLIYKSRKNNLFLTLAKKRKMPITFDFATDILETEFVNTFTLSDFDTVFKELNIKPKLFAYKRIKTTVQHLHKILDLRDELYLKTSDFVMKMNTVLISFAKNIIKKAKISEPEDIFYFDFDEIKRLYNDTYFGEIKNSVIFRKSQEERFNALLVPNDIYYKDIENILSITESMYKKLLDTTEFETITLFSKDVEGKTTNNLNLKTYTDKIVATSKLPTVMLDRFKDAKGIIIDSNSMFSYMSEFAALYDIPIHSGIRFAHIVMDSKKVQLKNNSVSVAT